jgi:hypothetical protein
MEFDIFCTGEKIIMDLTTTERSKLFGAPKAETTAAPVAAS